MDAARNHGLGLYTRSNTSIPPDAILSTAPASPTDDNMSGHKQSASLGDDDATNTTVSQAMPPEHTTLASMSFGPATQQTVVTTTTTTTVNLPPLIMNPPKDLYERDPKQYPLAFTPTPQSIKRFNFEVHGRPATFHESENVQETMKRHHELQAKMRRHNGSLRLEQERDEQYETPTRGLDQPRTHRSLHAVRASEAPKRTATPPSIAEAAELASLQRRAKKPRSQLHRTQSEMQEVPSLNQRAASGAIPDSANPAPVTPDTDAGVVEMLPPRPTSSRNAGKRRRSPGRIPQSKLRELQDEDEGVGEEDVQEDDSQLGPPFHGKRSKGKRSLGEVSAAAGATATPPAADADLEPDAALPEDPGLRRPNLPSILTSSQQDASLPSPSLSPITAAANMASRQNAFDASFARHNEANTSGVPGWHLDDDSKTQSSQSFDSLQALRAPAFPLQQSASGNSGPTVMDIPTMVDAFDSMSEGLQSYIMYQFLRRCTKPTLQMVASTVNPALKCDPFNILPAELGLNITRYLDARSMCRAAQVSKRWRRLINSDERAWKNLLQRDGFAISQSEVVRAVKEGWGWQHPGEEGYEEDLSKQMSYLDASSLSDEEETTSSSVTRAKRRSQTKHSSSKKSKRTSKSASSGTKHTPIWKKMMTLAKGPVSYANAATHAVQWPPVGLDSLRGMHLYKSLYQRHFLIRKAWMADDSAPQHLAFRAHHRHVVTCLLFDSDKILTGSDDTKINVYDTKTGALRTRLEGHEGGVWALQYEGDTLVSGSTDRSVRVWDIKSGKCLQVFQGHTSTVRCLVILKPVQIDTASDGTPIMMPKEPLIITGSRDSTLRVWKLPNPGDRSVMQAGPPANDRDNPYFLRTLSGHHNSVRAIAAHGDTLVSGSYDCTVRVWKISTGDLVHRLQGHSQKVYSVVLDPERGRCISGSMDNLVKVWDLASGTCLFNLEGHSSLVGLLDLSHDRLVSAAADSTLRVWDPDLGTCRSTLSAHTGAITCFQHDAHKVISGSDRTLKMWNVRTGECVRDLLTELSGVWQVRFDERRCVAAVQRNNLTYIEVLDFGAARDGVPASHRGRRTVVNTQGREVEDVDALVAAANAAGDGDAAANA